MIAQMEDNVDRYLKEEISTFSAPRSVPPYRLYEYLVCKGFSPNFTCEIYGYTMFVSMYNDVTEKTFNFSMDVDTGFTKGFAVYQTIKRKQSLLS